MGLSSKQVSSDGRGWSQSLLQANTLELPKPASMKRPQLPQNQQQQAQQLNCPRCDSTNTKFCYYNNYNKSQPRHFCKTCKKHWTKGGTLRNVPVGGALKNKRLKTSTAAAAAATTSTHLALQSQQQGVQNPSDQKTLSHVLYQPLIHPQNQSLIIPYLSTSTSFNTTPSSISSSFQLSNTVDNYAAGEDATNIISSTTSLPVISRRTSFAQPWQLGSTSSGMNNLTSYWNWDDFDTFVSTDLNIPWEDSDIKP